MREKQDRDFNNLHRWLPAKLKKAGLSVERLSQLANITRATIYFWMTDKARPSEDTMLRVCRVLGVPFEEGLRQFSPKTMGRPRTRKPQERKRR
jgi:transcriptional regulator with XRE-family HTH domain